MNGNVKGNVGFTKHPKREGVFMKDFFSKDETDGRLNNVEIKILPGFCITEHTHGDAGEYFYVIVGQGEFLDDTEWVAVRAGDAFQAPAGMRHAVRNNGTEELKLFSTFCPPVR